MQFCDYSAATFRDFSDFNCYRRVEWKVYVYARSEFYKSEFFTLFIGLIYLGVTFNASRKSTCYLPEQDFDTILHLEHNGAPLIFSA